MGLEQDSSQFCRQTVGKIKMKVYVSRSIYTVYCTISRYSAKWCRDFVDVGSPLYYVCTRDGEVQDPVEYGFVPRNAL
jgi:hypothetical protein